MPDNNLFEIQRRIAAAKQTRKITRTMELIASSRLQRGKKMLAHYRAWAGHMSDAAQCLPDSYFEPPEGPARGAGKNAYLIFGGKKGLSGAYSPNLLQYAKPIVQGHRVIAIGSAAEAAFPDALEALGDTVPSADFAAAIVQAARAVYDSGEADAVHMIYMRGSRHVTEQLFPPKRPGARPSHMIFEPSAHALFPALAREYAETTVCLAHLQTFVAEQVARVSAMDSATRNADDIIADLNANYNRIRQTSITQEIIMVGNAAKGDGVRL